MAPVFAVRELLDDAQYAAQRFLAPSGARHAQKHWQVPTIPTVWNGQRFAPGDPAPAAMARRPCYEPRPARRMPRASTSASLPPAPAQSAMLADLGADVIKVEASAYIDPFRMWDKGLGAEDWWNKSRFFDFTNRNKRGLALDLKTAKGKELFLDLVAKADVVVENFRRGVLERLGLGYDVLSARNPRLVLVSVTSQGQTGPDAKAASFGSTLEATSGLADLTRDAQGVPLISGILLNYPDQIVSLYAAGVATLAVMEQRRTGRGAWLDISQRELASFLCGEHVLAASAGAVAAPADAAPPPATKLVATGDSRWLLCHGASRRASTGLWMRWRLAGGRPRMRRH